MRAIEDGGRGGDASGGWGLLVRHDLGEGRDGFAAMLARCGADVGDEASDLAFCRAFLAWLANAAGVRGDAFGESSASCAHGVGFN
jgi:hypothetical protein